jgi:hypothetical protein
MFCAKACGKFTPEGKGETPSKQTVSDSEMKIRIIHKYEGGQGT